MYPQPSTTSRYVALVAALTALYSIYGYVSGIAFQPITQSLDLFFLLPVFFAVLVSFTGKRWSSTLLGVIIGVLFLYPTAGVPFPPHIAISLIVNGLVFDLYLRESKTSLYDLTRRQLLTAGALGNAAMAAAGLSVLAIFSPQSLVLTIFGSTFPVAYFALFALVGDTLVGAAGGFFAGIVVERMKGVQTRKILEASSSVKIKA